MNVCSQEKRRTSITKTFLLLCKTLRSSVIRFWAERGCKPGRRYGHVRVVIVVVQGPTPTTWPDHVMGIRLSRDGTLGLCAESACTCSTYQLTHKNRSRTLCLPRSPAPQAWMHNRIRRHCMYEHIKLSWQGNFDSFLSLPARWHGILVVKWCANCRRWVFCQRNFPDANRYSTRPSNSGETRHNTGGYRRRGRWRWPRPKRGGCEYFIGKKIFHNLWRFMSSSIEDVSLFQFCFALFLGEEKEEEKRKERKEGKTTQEEKWIWNCGRNYHTV